ncbi:MAG TPA: MFS transporter [Dehalococcoidia bacterium]|nr:MFS transporter [Dehalococcoidia bacterium]
MNAPLPSTQPPFKLSSLVLSVYLPTFLFAIGQGAVLPVIPLFAKDLGATAAAASLVFAMRGVGTMALDIPGGLFISRYGDKFAMLAGTALIAVVAIGASLSPTPFALGALILVMGGGWAFWQLARLAYVSEITPIEHRGRALSLVGGMNRAGNFVGPIIGGLMGRELGLESVFYVQAVAGLSASALMFFSVRDSSGSENIEGHGLGGRLVSTVVENKSVFLAAGLPIIALGILRQARQVFLPLWGDSIGLDVAEIGLVVGVSTFVDAAVFYPVGLMMDRRGRKWVAVPSLAILAVGFLLLPATNDVTGFVLIGMLTGFGNGLGSGIVMTLGADFAPETRRGEFLGVWRLIGDAGAGGGPLVVSFVIGLATLGTASVVCGVIGLAGALIMAAFVPETLRLSGPARPVVPSDAES